MGSLVSLGLDSLVAIWLAIFQLCWVDVFEVIVRSRKKIRERDGEHEVRLVDVYGYFQTWMTWLFFWFPSPDTDSLWANLCAILSRFVVE